MMEQNKECVMASISACRALTEMVCKGDICNEHIKCPFYKDEETYKAGRRKTKHRLKKMGLEHLLMARSEK